MKKTLNLLALIIIATCLLPACNKNNHTLGQQDALEIAWKTLDPNTISHNREDWEIHKAQKVYGKDVVNEFASARFVNCPGPEIPENMPIKITSEYWYVKVVPHPEALRAQKGTNSAELVPVVPEPNIKEATFLIDAYDGNVIARKLVCQ
jgi:hypothetical protein